MTASFKVVIPARYASTRLPGKPLADLAGKPLVQWVYEAARGSGASQIFVATDDRRIADAVKAFGGDVCMTGESHRSGTERLAEVARILAWSADEIIVNVQGDEPLIPPAVIAQTAHDLAAHPEASLATLSTPVTDIEELFDPNVVKVITDRSGYAIYFSRAPIPWDRDGFDGAEKVSSTEVAYARHLGIYAYRAGYLRDYAAMQPCALEQAEKLEQLRAIWHGHRIHVATAAELPGHGVDTPADLEKVRQFLNQRPSAR